ncbi:MAG: DUF6198 family protein [Treponema sp.]
MKKIKIYSEVNYILAILLLAFAVAMITCTNFGVSMVVAPAYVFSRKFTFLTFGQSEYIIQAVVFIFFCLLIRKFKLVYLSSFLTCVIYGAVLDAFRFFIPVFNPAVTAPNSIPFIMKIIFFILGILLTTLSIAMFYRTYFYPQVYDFFVKGVSEHFNFNRTKFKIICDVLFLVLASVMSLLFFKKFVGVGWGTLVITCVNGILIGLFGKLLDKYFEVVPAFKKLATKFEL